MNNEEIKEKLLNLADEEYKKFHTSLCPNTIEILGVRAPKLRNFAKEIAKNEDIKKYLENAKDDSYEEILLQGMILGLWKTSIEEFSYYLEKFVPKIQSWAICDMSVAGFKITKKNKQYMWKFLQKYLKSNKEYELRFVIVMLLDYYIEEEYLDKVFEILNSINNDEYYVKMAKAWTIQVSFVKFPKETMKFLKNNKIDDWTYNKALQKIIESYRVDEETKQIIKNMKR